MESVNIVYAHWIESNNTKGEIGMSEDKGVFGKFCIFCTAGAIVIISLITLLTLLWVWFLA